jgi:hypothetical protein
MKRQAGAEVTMDERLRETERQKSALAEGATPQRSDSNQVQQNRSQALRLRTGFADQYGNERSNYFYSQQPSAPTESKAPAAPASRARPEPARTTPAAPPPAPGTQSPAKNAPEAEALGFGAQAGRYGTPVQQRVLGREQAERLQRAVIIFRVVPEAGGETQEKK